MIYKVLIAIDWENINFGNKTDWNFIKEYPPNAVTIYVFHSDITKSTPPIFPHIPVVYEPTPKQEQINGAKNCTDRHIIKTVLKKILIENYTEVVVVSDDKGFEKLTALLQQIDIKASIEYSELKKLRQYKIVERILSILDNSMLTYEELQNSYFKKYNTNLDEYCMNETKLKGKELLNKMISINIIQLVETKYSLKEQLISAETETEILESLDAIIQILRNKHQKGSVLDRSSLFNAIKGNTIFSDRFNSKTTKDKIIEKLIEKGVLIKNNNEDYMIQ